MKKLWCMLALFAFSVGNGIAEDVAKNTPAHPVHAAQKSTLANGVKHRGTNPAAVGGAAKKPAGVSGADIHLKRY